MTGTFQHAVRGTLAVLAVTVGVVFLPIAVGVMPERFFEAGCAAGQWAGTTFFCYGFLWNTLTTGIFIGIMGPTIGMFLVHREMALIGETLAHTAFAGVAFGTLLLGVSGWDVRLLAVAIVVAIGGALAVQELADRTGSYGDVPIAIMLTGSFAVGTLFIDLGGGFAFVDINSYLFGNISITDDRSVTLMAVLLLAVVGVVGVAYRPLVYITFDEQTATAVRFNVRGYNALLIVLTALVIVGAMQILGVILVAAMLVVPVAAASLIVSGFKDALYTAILIGVGAVIGGIGLSWTYSLRPGASIVVVAIGIYLLAVVDSTSRSDM